MSVSYETSNGTAISGRDYQRTHGQVVFEAGETTQTVGVRIHGD